MIHTHFEKHLAVVIDEAREICSSLRTCDQTRAYVLQAAGLSSATFFRNCDNVERFSIATLGAISAAYGAAYDSGNMRYPAGSGGKEC